MNEQLIKPSNSSTDTENLVKIGSVLYEITRLERRPLKTEKNQSNIGKAYSSPG